MLFVFSCVEYYTTQCVFDITNTELANGIGSYMTAMRAFAECAEVYPEPVGYCHDSIQDAGYLANHDVCGGLPEDDPATEDVNEALGATTDIGFHVRIPFQVTTAGLFTFRYHMDMGLGSYMGVDGPEFRVRCQSAVLLPTLMFRTRTAVAYADTAVVA